MKEQRVTFHEANSVFMSIQAAGKKDLAKRARSVAFQILYYENLLRELYRKVEAGATEKELLGIIDTAMGKQS